MKRFGRKMSAWAAILGLTLGVLLLGSAPAAQASAFGCDPWPKPPVLTSCFHVKGSGTYVDKVDFKSVNNAETKCGTRGLIEFYDMRGWRVFAYERDFGCAWGASFWEQPKRHFPEGAVCARHMIDGKQAAGVCHQIRR